MRRARAERYFLRGCYADNVTANAGAGGATFGSAELTFSGDTVQVPLGIGGLLTGSEGGYTYTLCVGGSGVVTGGTQRVVLASDVALPTGANVIGAVTQSGTWNIATVSTVTSLSQFAGNAIDTNSGNKSAGTLRVVLATDQPQLTNKLLVTPDANSAVNVAQVGGNNISAGNGASGTGVIRVTIANDSTGIVALTTSVAEIGNVKNSGTFAVQNNGHGKTIKNYTGTISATTTIIGAVASKRIKVFAVSLITAATTAVTVTFKDGAGGAALYTVPLQAITGTNFGIAHAVTLPAFLFATTAATLLEAALSAGQSVTINVSYWDDDAT